MRYLLLIYEEPPATPPTDEEWAAMMPEYNAFGDWLAEKGWMQGGEALQDVSTATTVSVRDGRRIVTDGPFAETKEHLGGYYLIDAPSPRRRHRGRRPDPGRPDRQGRGAPDHGVGLIAAARRSARGRRPRLPRGARAGRRHPDPRPGRLRSRRGGGRGRLPHRARALAGRWRAGEPGGMDHHDGAQPGHRPGPARAPVHREGARRSLVTRRSTRRGA